MGGENADQFGAGRGRGRLPVGGESSGESSGSGGKGSGGSGQQSSVEEESEALLAKSVVVKGQRAVLAVRPDAGGNIGQPKQFKVNFFPIKPATNAGFHLYTLVIQQCRWLEFQPLPAGVDAKAPRPLTPLEKHQILYFIRERSNDPGYIEWNNATDEIVYDGNATLLTVNPIPQLDALMRNWTPESGRPIPSFHFGAPVGEALDEDVRGRELTLNRIEATIGDMPRPARFRVSLTPVLNHNAQGPRTNRFLLDALDEPHTPIAATEYRITSSLVYNAIFSQWCMNWESGQKDAWYGRKPSVALANPYHADHSDDFKIAMPNGVEVWYGIYFAVRMGRMGGVTTPFINLDIKTGVMYTEQTFLQYAAQLLGGLPPNTPFPPSFTASQAVTINRHCAGLKVRSTHNPRNYTIKALRNDQTPANTRFACEQFGGEISVNEYFLQKYRFKLAYPNMGMLEMRGEGGRGGKQVTWVPCEVLEILKRQEARAALPENAASIMIKKLCTPAPEREQRIMKLAVMARFGADPWSARFKLTLTPQMHCLKGRVLPAPPIHYANASRAQIKDGVWNNAGKLVQASPIPDKSVLIFSFARIHPNIGNVAQDAWNNLRRAATGLGIDMGPNIYLFNQNLSYDYDTLVKQLCGSVSEARDANLKVSLLIVLMKERNPALYAAVKYVGDHFLGIPSQCLLLKTVTPLKSMTASNILLKINAKLGGANWRVRFDSSPNGLLGFMTEPVLVCGVDVSHPKPGDSRAPSIASVVGNTDRDFTKWNATIAVSHPDHEDVPYFRYAFENRMFAFLKKTKKVPRRIILIRDGVSESQYDALMADELHQIQDSIKTMYAHTTFIPKLTMIVCIKRHQMRMFPTTRADAIGRAGNVAPGAVIDSDIASPDEFDFWLTSHFGLQGTSRPTYYQVLFDENNLSSDQTQTLLYWLAHSYCRCTRAVSYPTPTYYAALAAERARYHLAAEHTSREDSKLSSSPSDDDHRPPHYTPSASYASDALSKAAAQQPTTTTTTSSSSAPQDEPGVKTPEDIYKGVSSSLHRLQLAATVSPSFTRNDNLYFI